MFDWFKKKPDPVSAEERALAAERHADIEISLRSGDVPATTKRRLDGIKSGTLPWIATLTPAELLISRSHGFRPIASVSATCWLHYGWSWTEGHSQGWETALDRLRQEARAAGANAVLDVKMRTVPLRIESSMDFTLIGTAVRIEGLPPSKDPIVATVPALEFAKLIEADVVPTGIAIGADYEWLNDWQNTAQGTTWLGNREAKRLSNFWEMVRRRAHAQLRKSAAPQGNGVLAHTNFSQLFEFEGDKDKPTRYLGRHIVVATTVDAKRSAVFDHGIKMVVDMQDGTPLTGTTRHHQAYASNEREGAI
jgi:hypothetical protein